MSIEELKRDFTEAFESACRGHRNRFDVFRDWAECAMMATYNSPVTMGILKPDDTYHAFEKRYLEIVANYSQDEVKAFIKMLGIVQVVLEETKLDFLGSIYQELEIGGKPTKGEFFTPFPLAQALASVTLEKDVVQRAIDEKGYISFYEPCVGAGSLLIAASLVLEESGIDPRKYLLFKVADINAIFCNMTYIQAASLELIGWVCHENSLTQERWQVLTTPRLQVLSRKDDLTFAAKIYSVVEEFNVGNDDDEILPHNLELEIQKKDKITEVETQAIVVPVTDATNQQLNFFDLLEGEDSA
ncbi:MAG: N-6 DNA methylase [Symploca sp. SIO3C6]|nr:N-6 DNA methylase [Symploca sp. SIO3C6]